MAQPVVPLMRSYRRVTFHSVTGSEDFLGGLLTSVQRKRDVAVFFFFFAVPMTDMACARS